MRKSKLYKQLLEKCIKNNYALLIYGKSECNMTKTMNVVATSLGFELKEIKTARGVRQDILGIPTLIENDVKVVIPKLFYKKDNKEKRIVLLSGINGNVYSPPPTPKILHALFRMVVDGADLDVEWIVAHNNHSPKIMPVIFTATINKGDSLRSDKVPFCLPEYVKNRLMIIDFDKFRG